MLIKKSIKFGLRYVLAVLVLIPTFFTATNTLNSQITCPTIESQEDGAPQDQSIYHHNTYYDNVGRVMGTYESMYIPPVVKYVDGNYITLSPASFEERFTKIDDSSFSPKLQNVIANSIPVNRKDDFDNVKRRLHGVHRTMSHTMNGLYNFMSMGQSASLINTRQCIPVLEAVNKKLQEASTKEHDLAEALRKLDLIDESGIFLDQLRQRQIIVEKAINTAAFLDGVVDMGNDWNSGSCVAMGNFQKMKGKYAPSEYKARAGKIRELLKDYEDSLANFTTQLIEKITEYNLVFSEFERKRTELNSFLKTMEQKSQNQESLEDDFRGARERIKDIQALLKKLSKQASELDFQDEKRIFDAVQRSISDTKSTLGELEKAEVNGDPQSRKSQRENVWAKAEILAEQRAEELASELEAEQLRKDAEKARQAEAELSPKARKNRDSKAQAEKKRQEQAAQLREGRRGNEEFEFNVNPLQISRELDNFDAMFSRDARPNMSTFDNVMKSFLGEKIGREIAGTVSFDSGRKGDYFIGHYEYRDEKFGIRMEVGRITRTDDCSNTPDWNGASWNTIDGVEETLNLNSINYSPKGNQVTIALSSGDEKVVVKTDIQAIENYLAKKTVEKDFLLNPMAGVPASNKKVDPGSLSISSEGKINVEQIRKVAAIIADFLPYLGTGKSISELVFGHDYISGEDVNRVVAVFAVVGTFIPIPGAAKLGKFAGKVVSKVVGETPEVIKKMQAKYGQAGLAAANKIREKLDNERMSKLFAKYADTKEAIDHLTETARSLLRRGKLPEGHVFHHKIPLFRGGENNVQNLTVQKEAVYKKYDKFLKYKIPGMTEAPKAFTEAGYKGASRYYTRVGDEIVHAHDLIKQLKPSVQEQLKHMHIPEKPLVPGGGLLRHEADGGHVIEKHVGKSESYLFVRRASGRKGPISTFNNLEEAEYFIAETINSKKDEIQNWLKNAKRSQEFESSFINSIGKVLKKGEQSITDARGVKIVLVPSKDAPEGYRILTAFPIE